MSICNGIWVNWERYVFTTPAKRTGWLSQMAKLSFFALNLQIEWVGGSRSGDTTETKSWWAQTGIMSSSQQQAQYIVMVSLLASCIQQMRQKCHFPCWAVLNENSVYLKFLLRVEQLGFDTLQWQNRKMKNLWEEFTVYENDIHVFMYIFIWGAQGSSRQCSISLDLVDHKHFNRV